MIYLKINDTLYPASFRQRVQDADWNNRGSMAITVSMSHEQAAQIFVNGLRWEHVQQPGAYSDADGNLVTPDPIITDYSEYEMAGPITDNRDGTVTAKMGKALPADIGLTLVGDPVAMTVSEAATLRTQMEAVYQLATPSMTPDEIIQNRVMCKVWQPGYHVVGAVYEAAGQVWQCIQSYDNEVYPDIIPGNAAWGTFHKPYHGRTPETAMPWVQPTGSHDMYLTGEYMIWTDGTIQKCLSSTAYSPEEYGGAWEVDTSA